MCGGPAVLQGPVLQGPVLRGPVLQGKGCLLRPC